METVEIDKNAYEKLLNRWIELEADRRKKNDHYDNCLIGIAFSMLFVGGLLMAGGAFYLMMKGG